VHRGAGGHHDVVRFAHPLPATRPAGVITIAIQVITMAIWVITIAIRAITMRRSR
jgi:hypothetical protein